DITEVRFDLPDGLAVERDYKMQYAMRGRMLGADVDHQFTFAINCGSGIV
ncbi:MAG: hypothetical protein K0Q66_2310, partial [Chitinophagaceae bacterium]|nr:hypothetical protein [Chitinophagaceae bacterium]